MGFVIDMNTGEIEDISRPAPSRETAISKSHTEVHDLAYPMPRIQEYTPTEKTVPVIPESIRNVDIDSFLDQM
ncbi:MAG: hypothetical protein R3240_01750 [Gammaproteobacteria bacterium]|nr:hypothetical protein [Gammaproteobacteria bacterium]